MKRIIYFTVFILVTIATNNVNAQTKKQTIDYIASMINRSIPYQNGYKSKFNYKVVSKDYNNSIIILHHRIKSKSYKNNGEIDDSITTYILDLKDIYEIKHYYILGEYPICRVWTNTPIKMEIKTEIYKNDKYLRDEDWKPGREKLSFWFQLDKGIDAEKMYNAFMHMTKFEGVHQDMF